MATIQVIQTGSTLVSSAVPNRNTHHFNFAYTGLFQSRKKRITVSVKAFLVNINNRKILVDTGWSKECATNPIKHLGFGLWFASEPVMKINESIDNQIDINDIDAIILTHLDCDHVSGIDCFKNNNNIYVSRDEFEYANSNKIRYSNRFYKDIKFNLIDFKDDSNAPFNKSCDLFNDNSVIIYLTPGHSKGSIAVKFNNKDNFVLCVGDDGYNDNSWDNLTLPGPLYDKNMMLDTLKWISLLKGKENCKGVFAAHDTAIKANEYLF